MRDFIKKSKTHFTLHNLRTWYEMSLFTLRETALSRHNIWGLQTLAANFGLYEQSDQFLLVISLPCQAMKGRPRHQVEGRCGPALWVIA